MATLSLTEWEPRRALRLRPDTAAVLRTVFGARVEPAPDQVGSDVLWDVTPSGVVGAVQRGPDLVVIRPKIDVENVLFLLGVGSGRDPWDAAEDARLARAPDLTTAVAALFARLAQQALARGVLRGYREERADLTTVRGRIDLATQLRRRPGMGIPLAVEYSEHDEDTLENRLLLAAARALKPLTGRSPHASRGLHRIRGLLSEVTPVHVPPTRVPAVQWTRLNAHYRPAVELARTILGRGGIDIGLGDASALGITLDMAKVFEDFLCTAMGSALTALGGHTRTQDPWFLDADSRVRMKPDLVWYRAIGSPRAVIDAKYKRERPAGYPDADIYQMLAYCTALDLTDGHLVYAQGNDTAQSARVVHGGPTIHAHGLDLSASPRDLMRQVARLAERVAAPTEPRAIARPPAATR